MCTTKWYKQNDFEFDVFSIENFSKVIFLMDASYSRIIQDGFYQCFFFQYGTNKILKGEPLNRIGGPGIYDPHGHTFCLECRIPIEAIHANAMKINFIFGRENNLTDIINISICRSYESSFNFINSRLHLESHTKLNLKNQNNKTQINTIGSCTQTAHFDVKFPLWINYHYKMGIDHFYIYDHARSNETQLHKSLKSYIDFNIITIIPWYVDQWDGFKYHPTVSSWIAHQIWSQNDCIRRYGYLHSWMLISDVDEFIFPKGQFHNFKELVQSVPPNYCALQILHYSFRHFQPNNTIREEDRPRKIINRQRNHQYPNVQSKNFVRSNLVNYYSVHQITRSVNNAPVFYGDVEKHARIQHYQRYIVSPEEQSNFVIDTEILPIINRLNNSVSAIISK